MGLLVKQSIQTRWSLSYELFLLQDRHDFKRALAIKQPTVSGAEPPDPLTPNIHA